MSEWVTYVRERLQTRGLRPEREGEIVEDLARQLEDAYREARQAGDSDAGARAAAARHVPDWDAMARAAERTDAQRLARVTQWEDRIMDRDAGRERPSILRDARQDVIYGLRVLRARPGFTAVALLTLALGIGANTAIFSVLDAVMFRSLPVRAPDELVLLKWTAHKSPSIHSSRGYGDCPSRLLDTGASGCSFSRPFVNQLTSVDTMFSGLAASAGAGSLTVTGHGAAAQARAQYVSGDYFRTLGIEPAAGRLLQTADDTPAAAPAAVISDVYWQQQFAGDATVIGRTIRLNDKAFTIVGVVESRFAGLTPGTVEDVWIPLVFRAALTARWTARDDDAGAWWVVLVARLRPHVTAAAAQAAVSGLFRNETLHGASPLFHDADDPAVLLLPAQTGLVGLRARFSEPLTILMAAVGAILLIACANVAGLMVSRAAARQKEMALRLSLGASRGRLVRQLLTESLTLTGLGGLLGIGLARVAAGLLAAMMESFAGGRELGLNLSLDARVLWFTLTISIVVGVLVGLAPAVRGSHTSLTSALKAAPGTVAGARRTRWLGTGGLFVVAQVALTVVVLVGAGLLVRTLQNLRGVNAGFETQHVLTFGVDTTLARARGTSVPHVLAELQRQFSALPGIVDVSDSDAILLSGGWSSTSFPRPGGTTTASVDANELGVGPHFFQTVSIPLVNGRDFTAADFAATDELDSAPPGAPPSQTPVPAIVNQEFVRVYLPHVNPIGQLFGAQATTDGRDPGWAIVGVVADAKYDSLRKDVLPTIYQPSAGSPFFEIRTAADPTGIVPAIRQTVRTFDLPLFGVKTEVTRIDELLYEERLVAQLSTALGCLALGLAGIGLYGLLASDVARRTHEIGIRMALGAPRHRVLGLIVGQGAALSAMGALVGGTVALVATRSIASLLFGVGLGDPRTIAGVLAILMIVAIAACLIPARRATRIDPLVALREP